MKKLQSGFWLSYGGLGADTNREEVLTRREKQSRIESYAQRAKAFASNSIVSRLDRGRDEREKRMLAQQAREKVALFAKKIPPPLPQMHVNRGAGSNGNTRDEGASPVDVLQLAKIQEMLHEHDVWKMKVNENLSGQHVSTFRQRERSALKCPDPSLDEIDYS